MIIGCSTYVHAPSLCTYIMSMIGGVAALYLGSIVSAFCYLAVFFFVVAVAQIVSIKRFDSRYN